MTPLGASKVQPRIFTLGAPPEVSTAMIETELVNDVDVRLTLPMPLEASAAWPQVFAKPLLTNVRLPEPAYCTPITKLPWTFTPSSESDACSETFTANPP